MAEGLMKDVLKRLGKGDIEVMSAGVSAVDGLCPTPETIEAMKRESIDVSGYRSKSLTAAMIKDADLILVMAAHHMSDIIEQSPEAASKTHVLKEYGKRDNSYIRLGQDIADPIGRSAKVYELTLNEIKKEVERVAGIL
jgi:protein-tyrosine-phosphatase